MLLSADNIGRPLTSDFPEVEDTASRPMFLRFLLSGQAGRRQNIHPARLSWGFAGAPRLMDQAARRQRRGDERRRRATSHPSDGRMTPTFAISRHTAWQIPGLAVGEGPFLTRTAGGRQRSIGGEVADRRRLNRRQGFSSHRKLQTCSKIDPWPLIKSCSSSLTFPSLSFTPVTLLSCLHCAYRSGSWRSLF